MNRKLLIKALLIRRIRNRLKRKPKSFYVRPLFLNRLEFGEKAIIRDLRSDPEYHHKYFRMSKESFDEILTAIQVQITGKPTHARPITAIEKLAATIRYLATGNSQASVSFSTRISPTSMCRILRETMESICATLGPIYLPAPTLEMWRDAEEKFFSKWNYPNCVGSLDGKHIRIKAPTHSGSYYFNYKHFYSQVLLAVAGADYKFLAVDIGANGSQSDGGIFMRSNIGKALSTDNLHLPPPKTVGSVVLPHVIVADDAFPLKSYLMKPFPGKQLPLEHRVFNIRLSRARMVVECAFGIFAARWRIFHTPICTEQEFVTLIIKTCVILHNFLISKQDFSSLPPDLIKETENGNNDDTLESVCPQGSNNFTFDAGKIRNEFSTYFNGEGAVWWQWDKANPNI